MNLQPFTSLNAEWNDSLTGDFLWTKTNLGEAIAETMTPLSWSVAQFTFSNLAYLPGLPTLGNICGYPYFKYLGLQRLSTRWASVNKTHSTGWKTC